MYVLLGAPVSVLGVCVFADMEHRNTLSKHYVCT